MCHWRTQNRVVSRSAVLRTEDLITGRRDNSVERSSALPWSRCFHWDHSLLSGSCDQLGRLWRKESWKWYPEDICLLSPLDRLRLKQGREGYSFTYVSASEMLLFLFSFFFFFPQRMPSYQGSTCVSKVLPEKTMAKVKVESAKHIFQK